MCCAVNGAEISRRVSSGGRGHVLARLAHISARTTINRTASISIPFHAMYTLSTGFIDSLCLLEWLLWCNKETGGKDSKDLGDTAKVYRYLSNELTHHQISQVSTDEANHIYQVNSASRVNIK